MPRKQQQAPEVQAQDTPEDQGFDLAGFLAEVQNLDAAGGSSYVDPETLARADAFVARILQAFDADADKARAVLGRVLWVGEVRNDAGGNPSYRYRIALMDSHGEALKRHGVEVHTKTRASDDNEKARDLGIFVDVPKPRKSR